MKALLVVFAIFMQDGAPAIDPALAAAVEALERARAAKGEDAKAHFDATVAALRDAGDSDAAATLRGEAAQFAFGRGDYAAAEELFARVLDLRLAKMPPDHVEIAKVRIQLGITVASLDPPRGLPIQERAVADLVRALPADHRYVRIARVNLAWTLSELGEHAAECDVRRQILDALLATRGDDDAEVIAARFQLAKSLAELGDLGAAREQGDRAAVALSRSVAPSPALLDGQASFAMALKRLGDLRGARVHEQQVLETRARIFAPDDRALQQARLNFAATLHELGERRAARALQERTLEILSSTVPPDDADLQVARSGLACSLSAAGDYRGARPLLEQALGAYLRTRQPDDVELQRARLNLGATLRALGERDAARALFEQAVGALERSVPEDDADLQWARGNLAATLEEAGELDAAVALRERAAAASSRILPEDHPHLAEARGGLAAALAARGDHEAARALEEQVLASFLRVLPDDHPNVARARWYLAASLAREQARTGNADRSRFRAIAADFLHALGRGARTALLDASIREAEERLGDSQPSANRAWSLARGLGVFGSDTELERLAFAATEGARGGALLAARVIRRAAASPDVAAARVELGAAREDVVLAARGGSRDGMDAALARRDAAERALLRLARGAVDDGAAEVDVAAVAAALAPDEALLAFRVNAAWTAGEDGLDHERSHMFASVVRSDGSFACEDLGPVAPLEDAAMAWRRAIGAPLERSLAPAARDATATAEETGARLRQLVFDPLRDALGDARRIVFVADDMLHVVPFDALPDGEALLGERYRIEQRTTLAERLWRDPLPSGAGLLAVGAPSFNVAPEGAADRDAGAAEDVDGATAERRPTWERAFEPLTYTSAEARGIAALFDETCDGEGPVTVLEKRAASREAVAQAATHARFVHIATHGWFARESVQSLELAARDDDGDRGDTRSDVPRISVSQAVADSSPMVLCGLALAGANLPPDDLGRYPGLVTAEEIAGWDLSNCELAVLSACDTNVGLRRAGQGVASLQKALHMAGARSVITSLWKVGDESTKDLMLDFYRRLWVEKKPKRQALWEAKMRIRDAKDETGAPKYATRDWAAWVLTGDPE